MLTKLIGRTGEVAGRDFIVPEDVTVLRIGASPVSEIRISAEGVSREHARISRRDDGCWIEDAGSRNGTFINGQRLKSERLRHLDVVTLARNVDLIFVQADREGPVASVPLLSAWLEHVSGPTAGTSAEIPIGELTIGRAAACQMVINHPAIGKAHAKITRTDAQITIEDLRSANGTFVNDKRITLTRLKNGDRISIAGVAQLRALLAREFGPSIDGALVDEMSSGPAHDQAWRTRLVWSPTERLEIERAEGNALRMMEAPPAAAPQPAAARPPVVPKAAPKPMPVRPVPTPVTSVYVRPAAASPPAAAASPAAPPAPAPRAAATTLRAVELTGGPEGTVTLEHGSHTIGRRGAANVRLAEGDREASRIHAVVTISADQAVVEDRSVNGTFLNDVPLKAPRPLKDGDRLRCGSTTFVVRLVR